MDLLISGRLRWVAGWYVKSSNPNMLLQVVLTRRIAFSDGYRD